MSLKFIRKLTVFCSVLVTAMLAFGSVCLAETFPNGQTIPFHAGNEEYVVDLPAEYLAYTSLMGDSSPLLAATGLTSDDLEYYINGLHCQVTAVSMSEQHQIWVSVKNRSAGFPDVAPGETVPLANQRAFCDGIAVSRGSYRELDIDGKLYFIFEHNPSIYDGGKSCYISTFLGTNELNVRWESGNGKMGDAELEENLRIAESITTR